ncbi:MAG: hypothetical protein J6Y71_06575 [Ruminococcus sp.]|nr:hypothetical protein [Ruminococcus sp.]
MISILTIEERTLLSSLRCRNKKEALEILHSLELIVPVKTNMFLIIVRLICKLEQNPIDFAASLQDEEVTPIYY